MSNIVFLEVDRKHRILIPYENVQYISVEFGRSGDIKKANVITKDCEMSGKDVWFERLDKFTSTEEIEQKETKKIGF